MRKLYLGYILWWPVALRLILFSMVTLGTSYLAQIEGKTSEEIAKWSWVQWTIFWTPVFIQLLNIQIAFLDQTLARLKQAGIDETELLRKAFEKSEQ